MRSTHQTNIAMAPAAAQMYALEQFAGVLADRRPRLRPALRRLSSAIVRTASSPGRKNLGSVGRPATPTPD